MAHYMPILENDEGILDSLDAIPEVCPYCDKGIRAIYTNSIFIRHDSDPVHTALQIVFTCPMGKTCGRAFVVNYTQTKYGRPDGHFYLQRVLRLNYVEWKEFPDSIKTISSRFNRIYNQSRVADENGLDDICGPGYRKALEFLVKDYLLLKKPDLKEFILANQLGTVINAIDDARIKGVAKRAAWLGNDETHYSRTWVEKDIEDLKNLIQMTVDWIDLNERSEQATADMPEKKKQEQVNG